MNPNGKRLVVGLLVASLSFNIVLWFELSQSRERIHRQSASIADLGAKLSEAYSVQPDPAAAFGQTVRRQFQEQEQNEALEEIRRKIK